MRQNLLHVGKFCIALPVLFFLIPNSKSHIVFEHYYILSLLGIQQNWAQVILPSFLKHVFLLASLSSALWISFSPLSCSFLTSFAGSTTFSTFKLLVFVRAVPDFLQFLHSMLVNTPTSEILRTISYPKTNMASLTQTSFSQVLHLDVLQKA